MDPALVLQQHVQSLHRLGHKVSTYFLDIKGGFDKVASPTLLSLLRYKGVSPNLKWIISFLRDSTYHLAFQGSPRTFAPVSVGVPQGSAISPLLFVIYVSSLSMDIPNALTISYVDNFAVTIPSPSYRTIMRLLQKAFSALKCKVLGGSLSQSLAR